MEGGAVGHTFERDLPRDHPCQVWFTFSINFRCQIENQVSDYKLLGASSFKLANKYQINNSVMFNHNIPKWNKLAEKISQKNPEYMLNYSLPCSYS
jgi:hypothetical protein